MDKAWQDMTPRERDAAVAVALGFPVEWRWCARDPECGGWDEMQGMDEEDDNVQDYAANPDWYSQQPCYNWLDTDGPKENGWAAEHLATASRRSHWRVVDKYTTTDHDAARLTKDEIEWRDLQSAYVGVLANDILHLHFDIFSSAIERGHPDSLDMSDALWLLLNATPEQRCHAAMKAIGALP